MKRFLTVLLLGGIVFGLSGIAMAIPVVNSDFDDGTLQGWTEKAPFNGILGVNSTGGNPDGFMYARDTVGGGGGLLAGPGLSGDLSYLTSIQWDEYVYNNSSYTRVSTSVRIIGTDGTIYQSDDTLGAVGSWHTKSVSFLDTSAWIQISGMATFSETISSAEGLYLSLDTSTRASGNYESGIDNVIIDGVTAPVPEPATILLLGTGLVGLAGFGKKKFSKK